MTNAQARGRVAELFRVVGLEPVLMDRYPHEYSGGMLQRAVIAEVSNRMGVMYAECLVELAETEELLNHPPSRADRLGKST